MRAKSSWDPGLEARQKKKSTFNFAEILEIHVADTGDRGGHILLNVKTSKDIVF